MLRIQLSSMSHAEYIEHISFNAHPKTDRKSSLLKYFSVPLFHIITGANHM